MSLMSSESIAKSSTYPMVVISHLNVLNSSPGSLELVALEWVIRI